MPRRTRCSGTRCPATDHRAPADWIFDKTPLGKPFLRNPLDAAPAFSLSHTRGLVACAVTHGADVGVDVEGIDRDVDSAGIASRFFAPQEAAHLMALDEETRRGRFFELWTLKEALVKALGVGMGASLHQLAFTVSRRRHPSRGAARNRARRLWNSA